MKTILLPILILVITNIYSQDSFRLPKNKQGDLINNVNSSFFSKVVLIELALDDNIKILELQKYVPLKTPQIDLLKEAYLILPKKSKSWIDDNLCVSCYENEWNAQKERSIQIESNQKRLEDSIVQARKQKLIDQKTLIDSEKIKKDSISNKKRNPYDDLRLVCYRQLDRVNVFPFVGLDYDFSGGNLEMFLQSNLSLNSGDWSLKENTIKHLFSSKFNPDKEYLTVNYNVSKRNDIVGYVQSDPLIINSVDIIGSSDLIINLYIKYWNTKFRYVGNEGNGKIVENSYYGDLITLFRVSSTQFKISIRKGVEFDYESSFGINKPKK